MSVRLDHGEDTLNEVHEINVTPFIDVMLVLLIIFMVAAPLATACGLAAAIPAVVIYNGFARSIARYRGLFADASVEVLALVGRDLTRPVPSADERRTEERRVRAMAPGGAAR